MFEVTESAHARVGLVGNPSDLGGGACVSFTIGNKATVKLVDTGENGIHAGPGIVLGYHHSLIHSCILYLGIGVDGCEINYDTDIPASAGLSGSAAILIAALKAFNAKFKLNLNRTQIANAALEIENEHLEMAAGFQDRYVVAFDGMMLMRGEFGQLCKPCVEFRKLRVPVPVPFFLVFSNARKRGDTHNPLMGRLRDGDAAVRHSMEKMASAAIASAEYIEAGDWEQVGEFMCLTVTEREVMGVLGLADKKIVDRAVALGAWGANTTGGGGCVAVLTDDDEIYETMAREYPCMKPTVHWYEKG